MVLVTVGVLAAFSILSFSRGRAGERPNIVIIMADDMGFSDIGCYGGEIQTPNLDSLAESGLRFTQFYNTARCCPTRAALLTGLHQHQTGIGQMTETPNGPRQDDHAAYQGYLNRKCVTIAEVLGADGYHTYMTGKWHLGYHGKEKWPRQRGFDRFYGSLAGATSFFKPQGARGLMLDNEKLDAPTEKDYYTTDAFTDYALEFLRDQSDDRPFFLYLAYTAPHWPLQAREEDIQKYVGKYRDVGWDKLREQRFAKQKLLGLVGQRTELPPRDEGVRPWSELTDKQREQLDYRMAVYAAMVDRMDQNIGRLVSLLQKRSQLDNTLLMFLSDNGGCAEPYKDLGGGRFSDINNPNQSGAISYGQGWANASNTPFRKFKVFSHEGGIATPLIVHWPDGLKTNPGTMTSYPAQLIDLMPTILDVTGAAYPKTFNDQSIQPLEGMSFSRLLKGGKSNPSQWMYWEHAGHAAVRHKDFKALLPRREKTWKLYNLSTDRQEIDDLSQKHPELVATMVAKWHAWADRVGVTQSGTSSSKADSSAKKKANNPEIANCELQLTAKVDAEAPHGVVVAQGGNQFGYALHFIDGIPAFDVRIAGVVTRLSADTVVKGRVAILARLTKSKMSLKIGEEATFVCDSPGLIPTNPIDALSIGKDSRTAAGDYEAPNAFNGKILDHGISVVR